MGAIDEAPQVVFLEADSRPDPPILGFVFVVNGSDNLENYEKTNGFDLDKGDFKFEFVPDVVVFDSGRVLRRRISN
ncbi:MAG: hypothetical protein RRA15_04810 [bacterium]|nr:hypothetical protein [bacterium]MDT8365796.1 hypothetical protein [bacterium]